MNTFTQKNAAHPASSIAVQDALALGGRILLAAIFVLSGITKLGQPEGTIGYIASAGIPFAEIVYFGVIALELGGGAMLILGLRTRLAAYALGGFSLAAAMLFHADLADQNQMIHFLKNVALAGGMLQVAAFGPGRLALDRG